MFLYLRFQILFNLIYQVFNIILSMVWHCFDISHVMFVCFFFLIQVKCLQLLEYRYQVLLLSKLAIGNGKFAQQ